MKNAAAGMSITIVMNMHTATAILVIADTNTIMTMEIIAVADMTTGISIITTMRAAVVKNTTTNTEKNVVVGMNIITTNTEMNVVVGMNIITGITTMCRGIRRTASVKFATRTKNTAMCAEKVWRTALAKCLTPTA